MSWNWLFFIVCFSTVCLILTCWFNFLSNNCKQMKVYHWEEEKKAKQNIAWLITWRNNQSTTVTLFWWHYILFKHLSFWSAFNNLYKWFLVCSVFWWVFLLCFVFSCLDCRSNLPNILRIHCAYHLHEKSITRWPRLLDNWLCTVLYPVCPEFL